MESNKQIAILSMIKQRGIKMQDIQNNDLLIDEASRNLENVFQSNIGELDLPCSHLDLDWNWSVKNNPNGTCSAVNHLYHKSHFVAKYEIIFDKNGQVIDDYFITQ